jgi:hypothetical protein
MLCSPVTFRDFHSATTGAIHHFLSLLLTDRHALVNAKLVLSNLDRPHTNSHQSQTPKSKGRN